MTPTGFETDPRFSTPILTVAEVSGLLAIKLPTMQNWAGQRTSRPQLIQRIDQHHRGWPSIPLVGLVEASTLKLLKTILPDSEVRFAAEWIRREFQSPHPLAHRRLVTDGVYAFVEEHQDLVRLSDQQRVIRESIDEYIRPVLWAEDDYPLAFEVMQLPGVVIDPRFNAGRMAFLKGRVPVFAVLGSILAGDPLDEVATAYRLTLSDVEAVNEQREWLGTAA